MERLAWLPCSAVVATILLLSGRSAIAQPVHDQGTGRFVAQASEDTAHTARIFVHPSQGSDRATGNQETPLQTITQALTLATPGTVVILAPGRYSQETGERFPLRISDGVTLEGNVAAYGDGVVINGGSTFVSETAGRQNATAIAMGTAAIKGVTLTNQSGHGLWIEAGTPTVSHCLIWGSQQDGIVVGGDSRPTIRHSRFYQNRGNGITVSGTAAPQIQTNRIEEMGYGVTIQDQATPRLLQNYISGNRSGIVIQGRSRPILRQNHITRNRQDGVVTLAQAQPDLGLQSQPGGNQFSHNGHYAINAQASNQIIAAAGNDFLTGSPETRLAGRIDTTGVVSLDPADAPAIARHRLTRQQPTTPLQAPLSTTADNATANNVTASNVTANNAITSDAVQIPVIPPAVAQESEVQNQRLQNQPLQSQRASLPTIPTVRVAAAPTQRSALTVSNGQTIPITATRRSAPPQRIAVVPPRNQNLLPVPGARVPLGHVGGMSMVSASGGGSRRVAPRYRVLVDARSAQDQARVRAIAPGAFITRVNGSAVMQAGAYQREENANQMRQQLANTGLRAQVQPMQ